MNHADQREAARYRQEILSAYRAYIAYLADHERLAQAEPSSVDPFEGMSSSQRERNEAEARLNALPLNLRTLYDAVFAAERQQIQAQLIASTPLQHGKQHHPDAAEVARRALQRLSDDAHGRTRDDRRGMLPRGTPEAITWLGIDLAEVAASAPSAADYQPQGGPNRRQILTNLGLGLLALVFIPLIAWQLQPASASTTTPTNAIHADGVALAVWPITTLRDPDGTWALPVRPSDGAWPTLDQEAAWHVASHAPQHLCLPAAYLNIERELLLESDGSVPTRRVRLHHASNNDDLRFSLCGPSDPNRPALGGSVVGWESPPPAAIGSATSDGLIVERLRVVGPGRDRDLPSDQMAVLITARDPQQRDWLSLAPTLITAAGQRILPDRSTTVADEQHLRYLIPLQSSASELLLQLTLSPTQTASYRALIAAPPSRDQILRELLQVELTQITPANQTMRVELSLTNRDHEPLQLSPSDLSFGTNVQRLTPSTADLEQPLAPQERRHISIDLPLQDAILAVGPFRYHLIPER